VGRIILAITVCGAIVVPARAQGRPDFSGTWVMDEVRSASAHYPDFVGPITLVIVQTPAQLTVETRHGDRSESIVYRIYESEHAAPAVVSVPGGKSYWSGATLVCETVRNIQDATVRTRELRTLGADGREMTVESTLIVEHGYDIPDAKNYGTGKDIFRKSASPRAFR
jgi:hypothetical protein